jgi:hypothetical protein
MVTVGAGVRATTFTGAAAIYRNQGETTFLLAETLSLSPDVWAINAMVLGAVRITERVSIGANRDLVGVAGGRGRVVGAATLEPARLSLFGYGNRDRGSLNSEFFASVNVRRRLRVRGGLSHYVLGYEAHDGDVKTRYLRFYNVPFIALQWTR